jgi:hypothetical protein
VSPNGVFVTAAHVVNEVEDGIDIGLWHGAAAPLAATPVFKDDDLDIAILRAKDRFVFGPDELERTPPSSDIPHLRVSTRTLEEGEPVYSFGYPLPHNRPPQQVSGELLEMFLEMVPSNARVLGWPLRPPMPPARRTLGRGRILR